jgi:hypothetical protein
MLKNYFFFLTTASLLRFQNFLIFNGKDVLPCSLVYAHRNPQLTNSLLLGSISKIGQRVFPSFYAMNMQFALTYRIRLKLVGNGYYLQLISDQTLLLFSGQSHLNSVHIPRDVTLHIIGRKKRILVLSSRSRQLLQNFVAFLVQLAYPDVYRLKGLRYLKQTLTKKEGKKKFV